jgi:hypothetical protein
MTVWPRCWNESSTCRATDQRASYRFMGPSSRSTANFATLEAGQKAHLAPGTSHSILIALGWGGAGGWRGALEVLAGAGALRAALEVLAGAGALRAALEVLAGAGALRAALGGTAAPVAH